tara:strand:+ start:2218 stop:2583 length:366 start_codon:yes stop_codon:yes gene_type:complete
MRPTKYTTELGEQVIELMYQGLSIEEVCYELKICKQTFYNWCEQHPEFLDSKKKGLDFSQGWWMKQGRVNLENQKFNSTLFYMNMKNRFGWTDKQQIDQKQTNIDLSSLTTEEIRELLNED